MIPSKRKLQDKSISPFYPFYDIIYYAINIKIQ